MSTEPTQISDFFGSYPDTNDPLFNTYISRKQEFAELEPLTNEILDNPRGGAYRHQKFAVRYLTWYDRLLLMHDPGTGKSCIITHSAELFKNEYLKNPEDATKIHKAYILVRGPTLVENIRNEIVCKCTDRIYETELVMRSTGEGAMRGNITRELKTWYEIMTYRDFARIINQFEREEDLENFMSNIVVYIDEAHNVPTIQDITGESRLSETIEEVDEAEEEESYYETIHRAFHKGKRNKLVLLTATPMNNLAIDIIPLINLILPLNNQGFPGQMPHWRKEQDEEFAIQPLEYFEPYFRGRVSYIRALDTGARPEPMGDQVEGRNTILSYCPMSEFQYNVYLRVMAQNQNDRPERFFDRQRQVSNFVFPDESFGTAGFDRHVEFINDPKGGRYQFKSTPEAQYCKNIIGNKSINPNTGQEELSGLSLLSTKYAEIAQICKDSWPGLADVVMDDNKGIIFVYFADYVKGSGAILFGLCLREHGYEEFRETQNIFVSTQESGQASFGPCTSTAYSGVERESRINKAPRYANLSSKTPKSQIPIILNTLNSYENRYGQYLGVIIATRAAREGINVNNAVKYVQASSSWNASSNLQAERRVFRSTSHEVRLSEKKNRTGDPNATINVKTYNMAAVFEGDPNSNDPRFIESNFNMIDPQMYIISELKDRVIRKVMRYLKQSSIDCFINHNRNVRPTDIDGSSVCDYLPCNYKCAGIREEYLRTIDRTTKILYYSEDEIENASNAVRKLFSQYYSLKIEQIHVKLQNIDPIFIDMAIERMITDNSRILDRMGFFGYLRENQTGVIYLEKDPFEVQAHPENTVYNSVLIGTQDPYNNTFHDYVTGLDVSTERPIINQLIETDPNDPNFQIILEQLSLISKVNLLELALYEQKRTGQTDEVGFYNAIISAFNHAIFAVPEPIDLLQRTANRIANRGKSRGRKPNPNTQPKLKQLGFGEDFTLPPFDANIVSDNVILHTLLNQGAHDQTSYGATTRFFKAEGKLRILKINEGIGWRDVNQYEDLVYNTLIQRSISEIRSYYEQRYSIYGIVLPPSNKLHIRDRESENPEAASRDARSINDGRICSTWLKPGLVDILYRLNLTFQTMAPPPNISRQSMIDYLRTRGRELENYSLETFSDDKLIHFYQWYQSNFSRDDICDFIRQYFERTGRLFTGKIPTFSGISVPNIGSIQVGPSMTVPDYDQPILSFEQTPISVTQSSFTPSYPSIPQTTTTFTQPPIIDTSVIINSPTVENIQQQITGLRIQ